MRDLAGRHQRNQGPGSLRGSAVRRLAARPFRPIAFAGFAPAAIGPLVRQQPGDRAADLRRFRIDPDRIERGQHRPGAINVIGAPAAEPAAIRLLLAAQEGEDRRDCRMIGRQTALRQKAEATGADIGGRRVE